MADHLMITIVGVLLAIGFGGYVVFSRKTNARQKSWERQAVRDQIIAARKRMKIKGGGSGSDGNENENDNSMIITTERDKWFTVFLYFMIVFIGFLIINNIVVINRYDSSEGLSEATKAFMIIKCILYVGEVFFYVLFVSKMKRKIAISYVVFMIFSFIMGIMAFDFVSVIRTIPIYFVFKSQWHNFEW